MQTMSSCIISIGKEIGVGMHSGMMCIEMLKIETLKTLRIHRLSTCVVNNCCYFTIDTEYALRT